MFNVLQNEWKEVASTIGAKLILTSYSPNAFIEEHTHAFDLIGMPAFGDMVEWGTQRRFRPCQSFDFGVLPRLTKHSNRIGRAGLRSVMILFDPSFTRKLGLAPRSFSRYRFCSNSIAMSIGIELYRLCLSQRVSKDEFFEISKRLFQSLQSRPENSTTPTWLRKINWEQLWMQKDPSVGCIAKVADRHPDYVSRSINHYFGESFASLRNRQRVGQAARVLVNSSTSCASISYNFGFSDQPHMTRLFKKHIGITPSKLRDLAQAKF